MDAPHLLRRRMLLALVPVVGIVVTIHLVQASVGKHLETAAPLNGQVGAHGTGMRSADDDVLVFAAVGDIMLGTTYPDSLLRLPAGNGEALVAPFADVLRAADVAFGNLEGPLADGGRTTKCTDTSRQCYVFRTPTRFVRTLVGAGFDVLSLANNHAMDFGSAGRNSTIRVLDSVGIAWSGPPGTVARLERRGRRIACIAFSYDDDSHNLLRIGEAAAAVRSLADEGAIVVVSFHGGAEGAAATGTPDSMEIFLGDRRGHVRAFARAMVDAGADLVLGHGPHVLRAMEVYRERLIAYSLGNFATWARFNLSGPSGIACVLEARVDSDGRFVGGRVHPSVQTGSGGARRDGRARAIDILTRLSKSDFPETGISLQPDGRIDRSVDVDVHPPFTTRRRR
jgi:poly-gamma-glutamate capsule biosynthesis protein CapA/YwtB (metallophosphatase superfamily)